MSSIDRVPPNNIEAEEALLGSLLIDTEAIFEVASFLKPEHFYREQNRWIYEAILSLNEHREPVDLITLTDELRRRDQLEEMGGEAYVIGLINTVPTSINALSYGRIVEAASMRRRMISAASTIANLAYEEDEDINIVIDRAEQALFSISEERTTKDLVPVKDIARSYLDRIEELHARGDDVIGVPTGFTDLDRLLGGLNKSDLIIVAARPGMGKTALQMAMGLTAARRFGKRVAIFNLEMSGEQLVQRMIAAETRIDSQRLRRGDLKDHEWPIFYEAVGRISETSVFIDDTPSITPMQLRTKCRRLYAEYGLDLVMIDYLQLMQSERGQYNRVQEISEISRALKGLARELDVPVIAASQLSRAVESRQDKRPQLSDLRDSGCLTGDTLITLADSGRRVPIRQLMEQTNVCVWALNEQTWKIEPAPVSRAFCTGVKPVFRLTTRLGRTIRATANHRFRTFDDWKRLDELADDDFIALPRHLNSIATQTMRDSELALYYLRFQPEAETQNLLKQVGEGSSNLFQQVSYSRLGIHSQDNGQIENCWVQSQELAKLSTSDVYWDKIESIVEDGVEEVFDLTVPGHHNFIANDIVVHNSIEQDADIVMFIYRDDYYNPDTSERPNIAEISVAKHRNGPTAIVDLYWHAQLATFRNLQRQEIAL